MGRRDLADGVPRHEVWGHTPVPPQSRQSDLEGKEGGLSVGDVLEPEFSAVPPEATVLEVVFELSVKNRTKVFVVEDGRLIGVVDRIRVLDRILSP